MNQPAIAETDTLAVALDVGGTKFAAAVVSRAGKVVAAQRVPTPVTTDPDLVFAAAVEAVDRVLGAAGLTFDDPRLARAIGVGTAAPLDQAAGTVSPVNIPAWRGFPLRASLSDRYAVPVGMIGDGVAFAVGEHWKGAAHGRDNVLGMVVSTGVGGGLIVGGRAVVGATGNAGHIGHVSVEPAGPRCVCGGTGCVEAIASGPSIVRWAEANGFTGGTGTAADVARAAAAGNEVALAAFRRAGDALGMVIAGAVTLLDLDLVVIGGGVAAAGSVLFDPLTQAYARYATLDFAARPRVVPAEIGGTAGLLGAAAVVLEPQAYWPPTA